MLKIRQITLVLLIGGLCLPCATQAYAADADDCRLISPDLLKHAGLRLVWEKKLPMKSSENLNKLYFMVGRLFALSDHNYMASMDRVTGEIIFARSVAPKGIPVVRMTPYRDQLLAAYANRLIVFDPEIGDTVKVKLMGYKIVCPPARNDEFLYLSGVDNRLHVSRSSDYVELFNVATDNNSRINSILADNRSVIFTTDRGNIISMHPDKAKRFWQFDAAGAIVGALDREDDSLFFASDDTNIYRVDVSNLSSHRLAWKHQVPGVPVDGPRVTASVVYQAVRGKGVVAIDKRFGSQLWILPHGDEFLAEKAGRAYIMTHDRTIAVMDNSSGKRLYELNCAAVSVCAPNPTDAMIYVGSESGWVLCLQPQL